MGKQDRGSPLRRVLRALVGEAEEARRAAIERTKAKYPDAYPSSVAERERTQDDEA